MPLERGRPRDTLSPREVRALFLRAQGFGGAAGISRARPISVLEKLGAIQLDSVNVLARNHELVSFSRLGPYDIQRLTRALYEKGQGFEYWAHEASWLPFSDYRYFLPRMARMRDQGGRGWWKRVREEHAALYPLVLERLRSEGPLTAADFVETLRNGRGSWWDWKPAKLVLEDLFDQGLVMARDRVRGFQRLYDLTERVLPREVDTRATDEPEGARHLLTRALRALGAATGPEAADYYRLRPNVWQPALRSLVEDGMIVDLAVEGWPQPAYLVREMVEDALSTRVPRHRPTFVAPFDNLIWDRGRVERLFGFRYRVEIYVPQDKRQYGYYVLPLLARGAPRGRADMKLDRNGTTGKVLRVKSLWLENGGEPEEAASALRDLSAHLSASEIAVERTEPRGVRLQV